MKNYQLLDNVNLIEQTLNKNKSEFTKSDIKQFIIDNDIKLLEFLYNGENNKLKSIIFSVNSEEELDNILTNGTLIDGYNIFSFIEEIDGNLFIIPKFRTAFVNPFNDIKTVSILCTIVDANGKLYKMSSETCLLNANKVNSKDIKIGIEFKFYLRINNNVMYNVENMKGYQEASPYLKSQEFIENSYKAINQLGYHINHLYSNSGNFVIDSNQYEQYTINLSYVDLIDAADEIILVKWALRNISNQLLNEVTFVPKLNKLSKGSNLNIIIKFNESIVNSGDDPKTIKDNYKPIINSLLYLSTSLCAFGCKNTLSYLRLLNNDYITYSLNNLKSIIQIPTSYSSIDSYSLINKNDTQSVTLSDDVIKITQYDLSADIYQLLAGICIAINYIYDANIIDNCCADNINLNEELSFNKLPSSCMESIDYLINHKNIYIGDDSENPIFCEEFINFIIYELNKQNDTNLVEKLNNYPNDIVKLSTKYFHC